MRRILLLLPLCAALALVAAGCGSSNNGGGNTSTAAGQGTSTAPASSGGGEVEIKMQNIAFDPKDVSVKVGQKVKWVNEDSVDHNVVANSGGSFKSKNFGNGASFEFTPDKAGTIKYVCTIHPGMTGTLTVTQ